LASDDRGALVEAPARAVELAGQAGAQGAGEPPR
jgi:hypothetical protein